MEETVQLRGPFLVMDAAAGPIDIPEPDLDGGSIVEEDRAARNLRGFLHDLRRGGADALAGKPGEEFGTIQDGGAAVLG